MQEEEEEEEGIDVIVVLLLFSKALQISQLEGRNCGTSETSIVGRLKARDAVHDGSYHVYEILNKSVHASARAHAHMYSNALVRLICSALVPLDILRSLVLVLTALQINAHMIHLYAAI